jgi:hypothetical protein
VTETPSDRVLKRWREHATDPYEFYRQRWITPLRDWGDAWETVMKLAQMTDSFPQKFGDVGNPDAERWHIL